ncbi:MAG: hypothetical protein GY832_17870 [Chloroflexi bacterium]|nr:hypothetical protein [Chloroflexota bacterium]
MDTSSPLPVSTTPPRPLIKPKHTRTHNNTTANSPRRIPSPLTQGETSQSTTWADQGGDGEGADLGSGGGGTE